MASLVSGAAPAVTKQESEIYDRQIRLWGIEAQQRLQSSRILLAGRFSGTSAEVGKNLVLAGFSATIMDDGVCSGEDLGANFFSPTVLRGAKPSDDIFKVRRGREARSEASSKLSLRDLTTYLASFTLTYHFSTILFLTSYIITTPFSDGDFRACCRVHDFQQRRGGPPHHRGD